MTGTVCLQGGGEFSPGYLPLDSSLVEGRGPVVVTALAGAPGREYETAGRNGVAHHVRAGGVEVSQAPDVREDPAGALAALRTARVLVLPGGSPRRLLEALTTTGVGQVVRDLLADGGTVIGSSAGAMVLAGVTVLPEGGARLAEGLGVVPGVLVVPHWSGSSGWLGALQDRLPPATEVLGIPEDSGVVVRDGRLTAAGAHPTRLVSAGRDLEVGASLELPA